MAGIALQPSIASQSNHQGNDTANRRRLPSLTLPTTSTSRTQTNRQNDIHNRHPNQAPQRGPGTQPPSTIPLPIPHHYHHHPANPCAPAPPPQGHIVTLEITSGQTYRGKLIEAEDNMNVQLKDITVTARDGRVSHLEQVYIRGSHVRFFIVPDMLRYVCSLFLSWLELGAGGMEEAIEETRSR
jgi:small nuclear ribonucleoprotein (snRNP)-like protein